MLQITKIKNIRIARDPNAGGGGGPDLGQTRRGQPRLDGRQELTQPSRGRLGQGRSER